MLDLRHRVNQLAVCAEQPRVMSSPDCSYTLTFLSVGAHAGLVRRKASWRVSCVTTGCQPECVAFQPRSEGWQLNKTYEVRAVVCLT